MAAAAEAVFTVQSLKSDMAGGGTPLMIKPYTRPTILNFNTSRQRSPMAVCTARGEYLSSPPLLPRSPLNKRRPMTPAPVFCSSMVPAGSPAPNLVLRKLINRFTNVGLEKWCDQQPFLVGVPTFIAAKFLRGYAIGVVSQVLVSHVLGRAVPIYELQKYEANFGIYYYHLAMFVFRGRFLIPRSFALVMACTYGTVYAMKRLRGKEKDTLTTLVVGFVTPVVYLLAAGMRSPIIIIPMGVISSLLCVGFGV
ncbi:hypothetical protein SSX86_006291 [Deinandra increscens subsp. villosa]|uniref:Uncharacterized protein n=1 Tax=Deinandra increscens subsp. villosa TaxID=3103831 RepID=A0AAP0DJ85_9ASTR